MAKSLPTRAKPKLETATIAAVEDLSRTRAALERFRTELDAAALRQRPDGAFTSQELAAHLGLSHNQAYRMLERKVAKGEYQRAPVRMFDGRPGPQVIYVYWEKSVVGRKRRG